LYHWNWFIIEFSYLRSSIDNDSISSASRFSSTSRP
jgi:hypothetical protein